MFLIFKYIQIEFDSPHEKRFCDDPILSIKIPLFDKRYICIQ